MIDDMTVRNLAPNTMLCYLKQVHYLARYFRQSPEQLSREDIREYQLYLAKDRKVSVNSRMVAMTALRFLYGVTLQRAADEEERRQEKRVGFYDPLNIGKSHAQVRLQHCKATFTTVLSMNAMLEPATFSCFQRRAECVNQFPPTRERRRRRIDVAGF
jgi:hypothetical protein